MNRLLRTCLLRSRLGLKSRATACVLVLWTAILAMLCILEVLVAVSIGCPQRLSILKCILAFEWMTVFC